MVSTYGTMVAQSIRSDVFVCACQLSRGSFEHIAIQLGSKT